jgi:colicin import membrane protein
MTKSTASSEKADPFRFGWRYAEPTNGNGTDDDRVPLTPEEVLHPQEGYQIPENTVQEGDRTYVTPVLRLRVSDRPGFRVLSDCLVDWGVTGLKNHSPDVSVFERVADPEWEGGTFRVAEQGAQAVLVIEFVSPQNPEIRDNDVVKKVREYYRAGVPLYVIVDQEDEDGPRRLLAYRRGKRGFVRQPLDSQGCVLVAPLELRIGLRDERVICYDAETGEELHDVVGMAQARNAAALARQEAEQAYAAEAQARQAAEQARQTEAQARQTEAQARQQTEAALAAAQARIRELEAQAGPRRRARKRVP